jgi:hypothetical protein
MKITNVQGFPQPIADAAINNAEMSRVLRGNFYDTDTISVTELLDSPRIRRLRHHHKDEIIIDVSDMLFAIYGVAVHSILEGADTTAIKEKRMTFKVTSRSGKAWNLTGAYDRLVLLDGVLQDYKTMSVFEHLSNKGYPRKEREEQLNLYAWMLKQQDVKIVGLEAYGFMKDWKARESITKGEDYPKHVQKYNLIKWDEETAHNFILDRLELFEDDENYECTEGDRWAKPDIWALIPKGKKRAVKGGVSKDKGYIETLAISYEEKDVAVEIEHRRGRSIRCFDRGDGVTYCEVAPWCPYTQAGAEDDDGIWD